MHGVRPPLAPRRQAGVAAGGDPEAGEGAGEADLAGDRHPVGRQHDPDRQRAAAPAAAPVVVRFPTLDDVPDASLQRLAALKAAWPRQRPRPDPYAADFRRLHELMFSSAGLPHAEPGQLKDFVTSDVLALSGNTTSFSREWNRLGDRDASERFRSVIEYLLRGESGDDEGGADDPPLEDRFTALAEQRSPYAMGGVREPILMHVLTVARPERFLPLLQRRQRPRRRGQAGHRPVASSASSSRPWTACATPSGGSRAGRTTCSSTPSAPGSPTSTTPRAFLLWAHAQA